MRQERPSDEIQEIEVSGIMKLDASSVDRPIFIIQEQSFIGELSAQAWRSAGLGLGLREPVLLPLGTGLRHAPEIIQGMEEQQPSLILLATSPSLTRDLVKEARHNGVARGRAWLTLPGRVDSKNHAAIERQASLPLIAAALTGLGERDAAQALVHAHPESEAVQTKILELLQRSQHDTLCSTDLLQALETEGSQIMLELAEERMASGDCDFRTPVLDLAALAHFRAGRWSEGLFASMGAAMLRSLDTIPGGIAATQGKRALLVHGPGLLGQVTRQAWLPALERQGMHSTGLVQWTGQDPSQSLEPVQELRPDVIMLALLPQDAARIRPHLERALPKASVLEIPAIAAPELRTRPMDSPTIVSIGAWLLAHGRTAELQEMLAHVQEPMAFMHAMEAVASESETAP